MEQRHPFLPLAAYCSIGAGIIHGGAIGIHAEHPTLARLFIALTLAQIGWGLLALQRPERPWLLIGAGVNAVAVGGWAATRLVGISAIPGLEQSEAPQVTDMLCAALGAVVVFVAVAGLVVGKVEKSGTRTMPSLLTVTAAVIPAMWLGASHQHANDHGHQVSAEIRAAADAGWPRPFDPAVPLDLSGIPGVTPEQKQRAVDLIAATQTSLPKWETVGAAASDGFRSIRDQATGFEHYVNWTNLVDDKFLDPSAPESLVYRVDGDQRTLVSAMFMARPGTKMSDSELVDFAGPLIQWHIHDNLCWSMSDDAPIVLGITNSNGECPPGSVNRGINIPMVHVWIVPHDCGPFAAIEGVAAGSALVGEKDRVDLCLEADH